MGRGAYTTREGKKRASESQRRPCIRAEGGGGDNWGGKYQGEMRVKSQLQR